MEALGEDELDNIQVIIWCQLPWVSTQPPCGEFSGQRHEGILESTWLTINKGSCQGWNLGHVFHDQQECVQLCFPLQRTPKPLTSGSQAAHLLGEKRASTVDRATVHRGRTQSLSWSIQVKSRQEHGSPSPSHYLLRWKIKTKQNNALAVGMLVSTALNRSIPWVTWSCWDWLTSNLDTQLAHWDFYHLGASPHFSPVTRPVFWIPILLCWWYSCFGGAYPVAS